MFAYVLLAWICVGFLINFWADFVADWYREETTSDIVLTYLLASFLWPLTLAALIQEDLKK